MAEPIGPEVYLAIAASVQNAVNNYRDKKRVERNEKFAKISADSSKSSLTLPGDELLSVSGLKIGKDDVQWALDSPAHPKNWWRGRKAYDLGLILFLEFFMSAVSAGGTPASFYALGDLVHSREVGLVGFTTMYVENVARSFLHARVLTFVQVLGRPSTGCFTVIPLLRQIWTQNAVYRLGVPLQRLLPPSRRNLKYRRCLRRPSHHWCHLRYPGHHYSSQY